MNKHLFLLSMLLSNILCYNALLGQNNQEDHCCEKILKKSKLEANNKLELNDRDKSGLFEQLHYAAMQCYNKLLQNKEDKDALEQAGLQLVTHQNLSEPNLSKKRSSYLNSNNAFCIVHSTVSAYFAAWALNNFAKSIYKGDSNSVKIALCSTIFASNTHSMYLDTFHQNHKRNTLYSKPSFDVTKMIFSSSHVATTACAILLLSRQKYTFFATSLAACSLVSLYKLYQKSSTIKSLNIPIKQCN